MSSLDRAGIGWPSSYRPWVEPAMAGLCRVVLAIWVIELLARTHEVVVPPSLGFSVAEDPCPGHRGM